MTRPGITPWLALYALPEVLAGLGLGVLLFLAAYVWRMLPCAYSSPVIFESSARLYSALLPGGVAAYLLLAWIDRRWVQPRAATPEGQSVQTPHRQDLASGYLRWLKAQCVLGLAWWYWQALGYPVGAPPGHGLEGTLVWLVWVVATLLIFAALFVHPESASEQAHPSSEEGAPPA
jgi:hypothetical protein